MSRTLLFVGCLGGGERRAAIRIYDFNPAAGSAVLLSETDTIDAPVFMAADTRNRRLYVASETRNGVLVASSVDVETGHLSEIARQATRGDSPCHIDFDRTRRFVFVSNFGVGAARSASAQSMAVLPVEPTLMPATATVRHDGSGPALPYQDGPHAHCAVASPDNRFVLVADFGTDEIVSYPFDQGTGQLGAKASVCKMPPGAAPRTLVFARDERTVFATAEMMSSVATLDWDAAAGSLTLRTMDATVPPGTSVTNYPAEIVLSRDGRFLYAANRGHDSIAVFAVTERGLRPAATYPSGGSWPRCFCPNDDGSLLIVANQKSGEIVLFAADRATGALTARGIIAHAPTPAFVGQATFD